MAHVPARAAERCLQESLVKMLPVVASVVFAAVALCACERVAHARSDASVSSPAATAPSSAPLQLQVPAQPIEAVAPTDTSDNAIVDAQDNASDDAAHGPQVHGSVTAGIGYSKGYGTSTLTATDLDISGETDSGRTYDVQIHLMQSKGPGFLPYGGYYGPRENGR
jgi:hypothetical protein